MPDLEIRIAQWRRQMIAGGIAAPEVLDELESHLREDIDQRMRSGLSAQQAFEAAVEKIGEVRVLKSEFAKSGLPKSSNRLTLVRIGCVLVALLFLLINAWTLFVSDLDPVERSASLVFVVAAVGALYLSAFRFRQSMIPVLCSARGVKAIKFMPLFLAVWPLIAICNAAQILPVHIGLAGEMLFWNLCGACAFAIGIIHYCWRYCDPFDAFTAAPWSFAARQSLELARAEASGLYHDFIGTEHLLLGLLNSESDVIPGILKKLDVDETAIKAEIRKLAVAGPVHEVPAEIPLTPRARKALGLAAEEAKGRHRSAPGPEHIFLGLLLEGNGVAALALKNLDVQIEKARKIILE
jgi:Clp amino terminal domain, pathogenicity island component